MFLITDQSDIAYMFAFLTMNPVIFFSQEEEEIKSYNYHNLNYFSNREKIGIVINQITSISEKIGFLDIETIYVGRKPRIRLKNPLRKKYDFIVSVSHEKEFAIGIVIAEKI